MRENRGRSSRFAVELGNMGLGDVWVLEAKEVPPVSTIYSIAEKWSIRFKIVRLKTVGKVVVARVT